MTFITAHQEDEQSSVAVEMLNNYSNIILQSDCKGEEQATEPYHDRTRRYSWIGHLTFFL